MRKCVVAHLCRLAQSGNEAKRRHETYGFLFGSVAKRKLVIRKAVFYRGGKNTQAGIAFTNSEVVTLQKRRKELAARTHLRFVGCFHSHMVIDGDIYKGASEADAVSFIEDKKALLETIVFVRRCNAMVKHGYSDIFVEKVYDFQIRGYRKVDGKVRRIKVRYR
jgi:hypothetical protein